MGLRFCRWCRLQPMAVTISRDLGSLAFLSPRSICAAWSGCRGWCGSSPGEGSRDDEDGYSSRRRSVFVAIVVPHPVLRRFRVFISPLGNQVEVVIRGVHHVVPVPSEETHLKLHPILFRKRSIFASGAREIATKLTSR